MIIFTHHTGEPHGILGAQVAATFFQRKLSIPCIVVGVERDFSKDRLLCFIDDYYAGRWNPTGKPVLARRSALQHVGVEPTQRSCRATSPLYVRREKVVAFSHLCGRKDLLGLVQELKDEGFITILGGPQARQDYHGEPEADLHSQRFRGLKTIVDIGFQGPVDGLRSEHLGMRGVLLEHPWTKNIFLEVDWSNIYIFSDTLKKLEVRLGQVLNAIGCPYSGKLGAVILPPPTTSGKEVSRNLKLGPRDAFSAMSQGIRATTAP